MKNIIPLLFISSQLFSQTVTPLASSVIDDALLTANFASTNSTIEISNVNIVANDSTIGVFQGFTNYPVSQGIILSTGGAEWGVSRYRAFWWVYVSKFFNRSLSSVFGGYN